MIYRNICLKSIRVNSNLNYFDDYKKDESKEFRNINNFFFSYSLLYITRMKFITTLTFDTELNYHKHFILKITYMM